MCTVYAKGGCGWVWVGVEGKSLKTHGIAPLTPARGLCAVFAISYEDFAEFIREFETEYRLSVAKTQFRREINSLGMESG